ncbi:MAG: hypothetical protein WBA76_04790, partial [Phormidesmis sp.]
MTSLQPELADLPISRWGALPTFLDRYSLDVRSLALFRMGLALILLVDLFMPAGAVLIAQPMMRGILALLLAIASVAMLFGYHSRLATVAAWILLMALHSGPSLLAVGSVDWLKITMGWAMLLPLGAAYSADRAMNTALRPVPLRILSGATMALMAQACFISAVFAYAFWSLWSTSRTLESQGSDPAFEVIALLVVALEIIGPLLLWSPFGNSACRMVAVVTFVIFHGGLGLTTSLGLLPFAIAIIWLAFIPTSAWERLSSSVYRSKPSGFQRTGLKIYYDADCGFCKKVVHLIRMLLVLPHTPLATAQSLPEINEAMETQNSWVIVDWKGQPHYKFEGIAYVVSLSPVFAAFASVLRWRPLMTVGTHGYEWIATHR